MTVRNVLAAVAVVLGTAQNGFSQWHSVPVQGIDLSPDPKNYVQPDGTPDYFVNAELYAPKLFVAPLSTVNGDEVTVTNNQAVSLSGATLAVGNLSAFYGDPARHLSYWDMVANPAGLQSNSTTAAYPLTVPANGTLPPNASQKIDVVIAPGFGEGAQKAPQYRVLFWAPGFSTQSAWTSAVNGKWSEVSKWTAGPPDSVGAEAIFNATTNAAVTIKLDYPQTIGTLQLGNSDNARVGYTLSGSGTNTLTLDNHGYSPGGGAIIEVAGGTHVLAAPVILADNLLVVSGGASPWTLDFSADGGISDYGGKFSLTMNGAGGRLVLSGSNTHSGGTTINAGTLVATSTYALPGGTNLTVGAGGAFVFDPSWVSASSPASPGTAAVPEPSALVLLVVWARVTFAVWKRRRSRDKTTGCGGSPITVKRTLVPLDLPQ